MYSVEPYRYSSPPPPESRRRMKLSWFEFWISLCMHKQKHAGSDERKSSMSVPLRWISQWVLRTPSESNQCGKCTVESLDVSYPGRTTSSNYRPGYYEYTVLLVVCMNSSLYSVCGSTVERTQIGVHGGTGFRMMTPISGYSSLSPHITFYPTFYYE